MSSILTASEEKTNGTRLARLLFDGGTRFDKVFTLYSPDWNIASSVEQQPYKASRPSKETCVDRQPEGKAISPFRRPTRFQNI